MSRDEVLEMLTILDFMLMDLGLYLDTHPKENDAIDLYNRITDEAKKVKELYEKNYGPLCMKTPNPEGCDWQWIKDPWPYCETFNFDL